MIKATGRTDDGRPLLLIGLSGENVARLVAGEPISFDQAELPGLPPTLVVLLYGRTEEELARTLGVEGVKAPEPGRTDLYRKERPGRIAADDHGQGHRRAASQGEAPAMWREPGIVPGPSSDHGTGPASEAVTRPVADLGRRVAELTEAGCHYVLGQLSVTAPDALRAALDAADRAADPNPRLLKAPDRRDP